MQVQPSKLNNSTIDVGKAFRTAASVKQAKAQTQAIKNNSMMALEQNKRNAQKHIQAMKANDMKIANEETNMIANAMYGISQIKSQEDQKYAYSKFRESQVDDVKNAMPEFYDDKYVNFALARAADYKNALKEQAEMRLNDQKYKQNKNILAQKASADNKAAGLKPLSATDERFISQLVEMFNGAIFNEQGQLTALDPKLQTKALSEKSAISKLMQENRATGINLTILETAAKVLGVEPAKIKAIEKQITKNGTDNSATSSTKSKQSNETIQDIGSKYGL